MASFMVFGYVYFFSLHMYNSKLVTNSQIIVGAHLMKKKEKDIRLLGAMIDLIHSLYKFGIYLFIFNFFLKVKIWVNSTRPDP